MVKKFIKDGNICSFDVIGNKVKTRLNIGDNCIYNPSLETFLNDGWTEYVESHQEIEISIPTYAELVEQKMAERYTICAEIAIAANIRRDPTNSKYIQEEQEYQAYRETAKQWASEQIELLTNGI